MEDLVNAEQIDWEAIVIFRPIENEFGGVSASRFKALSERIDYLEAYCRSLNAYRGGFGTRIGDLP